MRTKRRRSKIHDKLCTHGGARPCPDCLKVYLLGWASLAFLVVAFLKVLAQELATLLRLTISIEGLH